MRNKLLFGTLAIVTALVCLVSCESESKKDKFGLLSWNQDAGSEVIEACGLNPEDYDLTCKTLPDIDGWGPENSNNESLAREASIRDSAFEFITQDYDVIAFQMNEYWNSVAYRFMEENPEATVYILDSSGTEVIAYQEGAGNSSSDSNSKIDFSSFSIEGKWKNVGSYTLGQVQEGAIVVFDGEHCNVVSPADTYAFYEEDGTYRLDCTTVGFADTLSFVVEIIDNDNIRLYQGSDYLELKRVG